MRSTDSNRQNCRENHGALNSETFRPNLLLKRGREPTLQLTFLNTIAIEGTTMPSRNSVSWIMFHKPIWTLIPFLSDSANVYWASAMGQAPASTGSTLTNAAVSLRTSWSTWEEIRLIIIIQGIKCCSGGGVLTIGAVDIGAGSFFVVGAACGL